MKILSVEIYKNLTNKHSDEFEDLNVICSKELKKGEYLTSDNIKDVSEFISLEELNGVIDDCWKFGYGSIFDIPVDSETNFTVYFEIIEI